MLESALTHFYIYLMSRGCGPEPWDSPTSICGCCALILNLLRWDGAGTPLAPSAGAPLSGLYLSCFSLRFSQSWRSFLLHAVWMTRVVRTTSALGAVKWRGRYQKTIICPFECTQTQSFNMALTLKGLLEEETQGCGTFYPKSVWEYKDIIKQPKIYEGVLAKKKNPFHDVNFP